MSEYTKGPWRVTEEVGDGKCQHKDACMTWIIDSQERALMASIQAWKSDDDHNIFNEAEANARLIAAAPELLEALQTLVDDCIHASGSMDYNYGEFDLKAAEAAILKARGETR